MIVLTLTLQGTARYVMKNGQGSDPLAPLSKQLKALTSKRKKTDADHEQIAWVEYMSGLYYEPEIGPYIPAENIYKSLVEGARLSKRGKPLERALVMSDMYAPLIYDGPRTPEEMYADKDRFVYPAQVRVGQARTTRTRPKFEEWATEIRAALDETMLDIAEVEEIAKMAGQFVGIGERRPMFGRYAVTVEGGGMNGAGSVSAARRAVEVAAGV